MELLSTPRRGFLKIETHIDNHLDEEAPMPPWQHSHLPPLLPKLSILRLLSMIVCNLTDSFMMNHSNIV